MNRSAIYESVVTHQRFAPKSHRLRYGVYSLLIDLDEVEDLARSNPIFSRNRWNLVSFHDRDHGPRDGSDLRAWFHSQTAKAGLDLEGGSVELLVFPRILGYTFNPITVWFGRNAVGELRAVLYEVHNTFGHAHGYLAVIPSATDTTSLPKHRFRKQLHVSPFFDRDGSYQISMTTPAEEYAVTIEYLDDEGGRLLTATQRGHRVELTARSLLRQFFTTPLLTLKVIGGIHLEALKLLRKGARYRPVPEPLETGLEITAVPRFESEAGRDRSVLPAERPQLAMQSL